MKANEIRDLTEEEVQQKILETRKELFNLRIQQSAGQLEKPSRIRELRRDMARMQTIMKERVKAAK